MRKTLSPTEQYHYDRLMVALESSLGKLEILIAVCDDQSLRARVIDIYDQELASGGIEHHRVRLRPKRLSLRDILQDLLREQGDLQADKAVVTVLGATELLQVEMVREQEALLGYLQWRQEAFRDVSMPVVLWVNQRLVRQIEQVAPDFWGWRGGVFWFGVEPKLIENPSSSLIAESQPSATAQQTDLNQLLENVERLEQRANPDEDALATLYQQLGRLYSRRTNDGVSRQYAIQAYRKAEHLLRQTTERESLAKTLQQLGNLYFELKTSAASAEKYYQEALDIFREVGDRLGEANTLKAIGDVLQFKKRTDDALDSYQHAILIYREVGDRLGEANTLKAIGDLQVDSELALEQYLKPALQIYEVIGDRYSIARILTTSIAPTYAKQGKTEEAKALYKKALEFWHAINLEAGINICKEALSDLS